MTDIKKVTVVGAGTMGAQIALQVGLGGYHVTLTDADAGQLDRAIETHAKLVARWIEKGRMTEEQAAELRSRGEVTTELAQAAGGADLVIEAIYENLEAKRELFRKLDELAPPHAILASNSSSIAISRLASETKRPELCCNLHFFHPVTVMELCEVVRGPETSDETVETAVEFVKSIHRVPVVLEKEIHGFIANRILFAVADEAMHLLEGGYASIEDIDLAVTKGLNWPMGIFRLLDFSGLDIFYGAIKDRADKGEGPPPRETLRKKIEAGELGRKTGRGFYDYSSG